MARGTFQVQIIDRNTGHERWITVQADGREQAINDVASLGEIVGDARLVSIAQSNVPASAAATPSEGAAIACAWLGLFCGPLGLIGMLMGQDLKSKTGGRVGNHAFSVGLVMTILWLFGLALMVAGN